jgi:hypothetical protein
MTIQCRAVSAFVPLKQSLESYHLLLCRLNITYLLEPACFRGGR